MSSTRYRLLLACVVAACGTIACAASSAQGTRPVEEKEDVTWLAVSLRQLRANIESENADRFMGATRIYGFTIDEEDGETDCILITKKEPGRPPLQLDDFKVAYDNVRSSPQRPACTINPRRETLLKLADLSSRILGARSLQEAERHLPEYERIARSPQDVIVFAVNADTHFAKVMVDADYHLKSASNGSEKIDALTSLTDIILKKAKEQISRSGSVTMPLKSYNRFWFNPGEVRYRENADTFVLTKCPVTLRTEEEAVTPEGNLRGAGKPDPCAKEFADKFTGKYKKIAEAKPLYRELENLYRLVAVADLMINQTKQNAVTDVVDALVSAVSVPSVRRDRTLPGRYAVGKLDGSLVGGRYYVRMPSCGGVSMDVRVDPRKREPDTEGKLHLIRNSIRRNRPSPITVAWEFQSRSLLRMTDGVASAPLRADSIAARTVSSRHATR